MISSFNLITCLWFWWWLYWLSSWGLFVKIIADHWRAKVILRIWGEVLSGKWSWSLSILWGQRHCLLSFNRLCSLIWIIFVHNFISLLCKFHLKSFYFLLQQVKINFNFVFITWWFDFCRCQIWFWLEDQYFWSIIQSRTFVSE